MPTRREWIERLRRRKHWIIALTLLLAIRLVLPSVVRWVAQSQASKALNADVHIGDVDLALLRGGIALDDVLVRAPTAPDTPPGPALIGWKRFAVAVRWLPLFRKTIQLREVVLEAPLLSLERLKDGDLNLLAMLPAGPPAAAEEPPPRPAAEPASAWQFGADQVVLKQGTLRFADLMFERSEPIEVIIDSIEVVDIALAPGVYGEPSRIHVDLKVDDSVIRVDARFAMRDKGIFLETNLKADRFPLRRTRVYIPQVGWSDLRGELIADVSYRLDSELHDEVKGHIALRDVTVKAANEERPALGWRGLDVDLESIDLLARKATLGKVHLDGASVLVRIEGGLLLPVLGGGNPPEPAAAAEPSPRAAAEEPASPWQWLVREIELSDSQVHVLSEPPVDVNIAAQARQVGSDSAAIIPVQLSLGVGEGSLTLEGDLRGDPPGLRGRLTIDQLELPPLLAAIATAPPLLESGRLSTDLTLAVGSLATAPGDVEISGTLGVAAAKLHPAAAGSGISAASVDVNLSAFTLAGALPESAQRSGDLSLRGTISVAEPRVDGIPGSALVIAARAIQLEVDDLQLKQSLAAATEGLAPSGDDAAVRGILRIQAPSVSTATVPGSSITVDTFELAMRELTAIGWRGTPGTVRAEGRIALTKLQVNGSDPKLFTVGAKAIEIPFDDLQVQGFLGAQPAGRKLDLRLGEVRLDQPVALITRSKDGIVMPQFGLPTGAPASSQPAVIAPAEANPAAPIETALAVAAFRLINGRIGFTDRALNPFFTSDIRPLDIDLRNVRYPNLAIKSARLDARIAPEGVLRISGSLGEDGGSVEINGETIPLPPFNPYAASYSSYSIGSGSLSLKTTAAMRQSGYKVDSSITLHDFDVGGSGGESVFQQQFGIPLSVALALLRDMDGNIILDVPVETDEQGTRVGIGSVVGGALRAALLNALASPLKLAGAIFKDGKVQSIAPTTLAFRSGRTELSDEGAQRLQQLASLLASRPGMGVRLQTAPANADARWLHEQALRAKLDNPEGLLGRVRVVVRRGKTDTILAALEARANDEAGEMDAETSETFHQWLNEIPPPSPQQLQALAQARLDAVRGILENDRGIVATRIAATPALPEVVEESPQVRLELATIQALAKAPE